MTTKVQAEVALTLAEAGEAEAQAALHWEEVDRVRAELRGIERQERYFRNQDQQHNTLTLDTVIDEGSGSQLCHSLRVIKRMHDEGKTGDVVTILINSPGGSIVEGLAIIDTIAELKRSGMTVECVVRGEACSMAGVILQAATPGRRKIGACSTVMLHAGGLGAVGSTHEVQDRVEYMARLLGIIAGVFEQANTKGHKADYFRTLFDKRKDIYFSANEAVELGLADEVG